MKRYLLDTSAFLTLRDDENGADLVADLLFKAQEKKCRCCGCFISLMEILYRVWKDENELAGRLAYEECYSLPVNWVHESKQLLEASANSQGVRSHFDIFFLSPDEIKNRFCDTVMLLLD